MAAFATSHGPSVVSVPLSGGAFLSQRSVELEQSHGQEGGWGSQQDPLASQVALLAHRPQGVCN